MWAFCMAFFRICEFHFLIGIAEDVRRLLGTHFKMSCAPFAYMSKSLKECRNFEIPFSMTGSANVRFSVNSDMTEAIR